jgi:hypothetical protein
MSDPRPAILVVYPFCLDHVGHGNIQRILAIARDLAANGFDVDLAYQGSATVPPVDGQYVGLRRVFRAQAGARSSEELSWTRRVTAFYAAHELPQAHMRPSAALAGLVRGLIEAEPYHAVVATYAFTAPLFAGLARRILTICDVQDILHEHNSACQRTTGQSSTFSLPEGTETFLWRQFDVLVAITPEDKARISADTLPHQHLISARHALATCASEATAGDDDVALYAGSDNQSNVQSVTWLLEQVWPRVVAARPSARLRIAGLICNALPEALTRLPGVELLGFQDDITPELTRCAVLAAPYLYGSGLKIKVVEAACAGKAIVTTTAGNLGTNLGAGRALAVHDDADAFAAALVTLLGDRQARVAMACEALTEARQLFSPEACYEPIRFAIRLQNIQNGIESGHGLSPAILDRVKVIVDYAKPARVVLWGNGSHTRSLVAALADIGVTAGLIVDGRGTETTVSEEGLPVVPGTEFELIVGDLVVLSSETFEHEMWRDLGAYREAGGHVLGLFNPRFISRDLLDRLSPHSRLRIGAPAPALRPDARPAVIVWDSLVRHTDWWRLCAAFDFVSAAPRFGARGVLVTPTSAAWAASIDLPRDVSLAPILEFDGRQLEGSHPEGGTRGLARASEIMAASVRHIAELTSLGAGDLLFLIQPSLSECLGLARALATRRRQVPTVVLYGVGSEYGNELTPEAVRAYWRLAVSELNDVLDGRLIVAATHRWEADTLKTQLDRTARVIGMPLSPPKARALRAVPRVVCLGHVGVARVRPLLEAIVEIVRPQGEAPLATIGWRSNQGDAPPWADEQWAVGLASNMEVDLLDPLPPLEMRAEIASADAVIIMGDGSENWLHVARQQAQAAGVLVLQPRDSRDLVAPLGALLRGKPLGETTITPASDTIAQPGEVVLGRVLELVTGRTPIMLDAAALAEPTLSHELATEMC